MNLAASPWVPVVGVTANRGDHADADAMLATLDRADWGCLQEMYDQPKTQRRIDRLPDWELLAGKSRMSPLVYRPSVFELLDEIDLFLLPAKKRAGKHNMAKWATGGKFRHKPTGRLMVLLSAHNIQTQYLPVRREAARRHNQRLVDLLDHRKVSVLVGADWNAKRDGRSMTPFNPGPWHTSLGIPTHGKNAPRRGRAIDGFMFRDRADKPGVLRLESTTTRKIHGSDHLAHYATFEIRSRKIRKPRPKEDIA